MGNNSDDFKYTNSKKKGSGFFGTLFKIIIALGVIGIFVLLFLRYKDYIFKPDNNTEISEKEENKNDKISSDLKQFSKVSENVAQSVLPSIVGIKVNYDVTSQFFRTNNFKAEASGSGIILTKDGYILTNNHIVSPDDSKSPLYTMSEAQSVKVTFNSENSDEIKEEDAKIIGVDPLTDLAIIKVERDDLVPAKIGNSDDVKVGQFAMAVGSPLGLNSTVTAGIISAVNRKVDLGDGKTFNAIQTDASINEGNSGGALVNANGEVIGINTLKFAGTGIEGIGFAIPINQTKPIAEEIIKNKKIVRTSLGIYAYPISDEIKSIMNIKNGIVVKEVIKDGSADKSGIKVNDIITKFNNVDVKSVNDINNQKINLKENDKVKVEIIRNGSKQEIEVTMQLEKQDNNNDENKDNKENNHSNEDNQEDRSNRENSSNRIDGYNRNNRGTQPNSNDEEYRQFFEEFFNF